MPNFNIDYGSLMPHSRGDIFNEETAELYRRTIEEIFKNALRSNSIDLFSKKEIVIEI